MEIQKKLNVLFWRTGFYGALTVGGFGTLYNSITNEFLKRGHNVHFASGGLMDLPTGVQFHLIEYNKLLRNFPEILNFPYNQKSSKEIIKIIEQYNIDFLYLQHHDFHYGLDIIKGKKDIPLLFQVDSIEYWVKKNWGGKLYFDKMINWCEEIEVKAADAILVISSTVKNQLVEMYNIKEEKIFVSPSGVDVQKFHPDISDTEIKEKLNLHNNYVIGYSGLFNLYHGIDTLIESIPLITEKIKNVKILLIGDGQLRNFVDDYVNQKKLQDKVIITGLLPFNEVPKYLAACDVLVSPFKSIDKSTFFNSPIKTFEYMAMGKPIVTTNIGQLADICLDENNSLVMEENNPNSLAEKVFKILGDPQLANQLGKNAREFVVKNYSWSKKYELIMEIYNKLK